MLFVASFYSDIEVIIKHEGRNRDNSNKRVFIINFQKVRWDFLGPGGIRPRDYSVPDSKIWLKLVRLSIINIFTQALLCSSFRSPSYFLVFSKSIIQTEALLSSLTKRSELPIMSCVEKKLDWAQRRWISFNLRKYCTWQKSSYIKYFRPGSIFS